MLFLVSVDTVISQARWQTHHLELWEFSLWASWPVGQQWVQQHQWDKQDFHAVCFTEAWLVVGGQKFITSHESIFTSSSHWDRQKMVVLFSNCCSTDLTNVEMQVSQKSPPPSLKDFRYNMGQNKNKCIPKIFRFCFRVVLFAGSCSIIDFSDQLGYN